MAGKSDPPATDSTRTAGLLVSFSSGSSSNLAALLAQTSPVGVLPQVWLPKSKNMQASQSGRDQRDSLPAPAVVFTSFFVFSHRSMHITPIWQLVCALGANPLVRLLTIQLGYLGTLLITLLLDNVCLLFLCPLGEDGLARGVFLHSPIVAHLDLDARFPIIAAPCT